MRRPGAAAQQLVDEVTRKVGLSGVTREQFEAIIRNDFLSFIQQTFNSLVPTDTLLMNWHIRALVHHLELARKGEITRLIINMPPRSLKSMVTSVAFPAFILGHNPSARLITLSYGSDLATKHANDFRLILNSGWYKRLFPATRISGLKNTEEEVQTTRRGFRLSTSVGGTLTGRGGNFIVIDDPLKPEDALSESRRTRV